MLAMVKAHAYGNDFLYVQEPEVAGRDPVALARAVCERRRGMGADGLILYRVTPDGARMRLINADGSRAEVSGNGVRGLGAILARATPRSEIVIATDAGLKRLALLGLEEGRYHFRAAMGAPERIEIRDLDVPDGPLRVVSLWMGNPQCVVLEGACDVSRLQRLGPVLAHHDAFPDGTNVELVEIEAPDRLRILIWERGVGPTESSGTGTCAAAVAAVRYAGAARTLEVASPGGTQRVEWLDDEVYLTGWAEVLGEIRWLGPAG